MMAVVLGALLIQKTMFAGVLQDRAGEKLTIVNGYAFVEVSINSRGPFRMMIDTGASSCSLRPEVARAAGLAADHQVMLTTMAGARLVPAAGNASVGVGPVEAFGVEVLSLELDGVRAVSGRVDGVLGQSFLGRFAYLIDYRRKLLWVGDDAAKHVPSFASELVAERVDGRLVLPVGIEPGGAPWKLALDTGANALVMRCGTRCPQLLGAREGDRILTNSGSCLVRRGTVHRITVGEMIFPSTQAALISGDSSGLEDGTLPANWFSAVYVDGPRNLVRLAK